MVEYDIKKAVLLPIVREFNFLGNLNYDKVKSEVEKHQSKAVASSACRLSSHTIRLTGTNCLSTHQVKRIVRASILTPSLQKHIITLGILNSSSRQFFIHS